MDVKKNKDPIASRKLSEEERSDSGCDVIRAWFARQPREVKIAVCAIGAMSEGDRGNDALAAEIVAGFEADLLADVQDPRSDVTPADMAMIGIWLGMEAVQGR